MFPYINATNYHHKSTGMENFDRRLSFSQSELVKRKGFSASKAKKIISEFSNPDEIKVIDGTGIYQRNIEE